MRVFVLSTLTNLAGLTASLAAPVGSPRRATPEEHDKFWESVKWGSKHGALASEGSASGAGRLLGMSLAILGQSAALKEILPEMETNSASSERVIADILESEGIKAAKALLPPTNWVADGVEGGTERLANQIREKGTEVADSIYGKGVEMAESIDRHSPGALDMVATANAAAEARVEAGLSSIPAESQPKPRTDLPGIIQAASEGIANGVDWLGEGIAGLVQGTGWLPAQIVRAIPKIVEGGGDTIADDVGGEDEYLPYVGGPVSSP